ncbi:MAG TPA: PAS domain-containing protein [Burkholderiales bacterium]
MNLQSVLARPVIAILAVLGVLFALDLFTLGASRKLDQAIGQLQEETQTQALIGGLPQIILDMQSGMRGYLLTGNKSELAQYRDASDRFLKSMSEAIRRAGGDEALRSPLQEASALAGRWLDSHLSPLVVKRSAGEGSPETMKPILQTLKRSRGDPFATRILEKLNAASDEQQKRIAAARAQLQAQSDAVADWMLARALALLVTVAALALLLGRTLLRLTGQTSSREAAERNARQSSAALQAMNDASPLGMFVTDASGACSHANAAFERITNLPAEALTGAGWQAALHPDDRERVQTAWKKAISEVSPFASEHRFLHRNGNVVWVTIKSARIRDGEKPIGYVCTVEDVSERRNAEEALRKSEERLQLALEGSQLALFDWHIPSGEILFSRQWLVLTGYRQESAGSTARRFAEILHPDDREGLREAVIAAFKGRGTALHGEFRVRNQNGQWRRLRAHGQVTERDAMGRAVQLTGTIAGLG